MESYNSFAEYYDELMEDARYPERCRYILQTADRLGHVMGRTLDLACGTGSLTLLLKQRGVEVFGADASVDMLSEAVILLPTTVSLPVVWVLPPFKPFSRACAT